MIGLSPAEQAELEAERAKMSKGQLRVLEAIVRAPLHTYTSPLLLFLPNSAAEKV